MTMQLSQTGGSLREQPGQSASRPSCEIDTSSSHPTPQIKRRSIRCTKNRYQENNLFLIQQKTCITFQYPVTRYDTTSSLAESGQVDKQKAKNNSEKSSTGNPGSGSAAAKTGTADLLVLHEKVAKLCETVGREWKCTILSTPMKGSYLLDSASYQHEESNGGAPNRPSHDNQHSNHPS